MPLSTTPESPAHRRIAAVVMGVSGCGKTTVGAGIADKLGLRFVDGDSLHAPDSVAKMRAGTPLEDADRWPWLDRIAAVLGDAATSPGGVVVACSALKRVYRDRIRAAAPAVRFVFLDGTAELIGTRLANRSGHYMPGALLESQLRTLERPGADEPDVVRVPIDAAASHIVESACAALTAQV